MNEDMVALDGAFSPLSLAPDIGTISGGYDFTSSPAVSPTTSAPPSTNSGANSTAGVTGFSSVLSTLTNLFDAGVNVYNDVAQKTGLPTANNQPTSPAPATAAVPKTGFAGFTQQQLILIGGAAVLVIALFVLKRR